LAKLRQFSGRELMKLLESHGFGEVRRRGSHVTMQRIADGATTTVVVPDHKEVRRGTLRSIIRQSQLPRSVFEVE